ncbi:hypothetical protein J6590_101518 [Homalodisca vitripennis]|nr:hypothetical protein J6590_101518 [Homalodisca vitripennis]
MTTYSYALRPTAKGQATARTISAEMNLVPLNAIFSKCNKKLLSAATKMCEASMRNAAVQEIEENYGSKKIAAAFDGFWHKRGHTSLNGILSVTLFILETV